MPDPVTELSHLPDPPTALVDGVLFTVTGPVARAKIQITDGDGNVRMTSTEFGQANRTDEFATNEIVSVDPGDGTGGSFDLTAYSYADGADLATAYDIPYAPTLGEIEHITGAAWGYPNVAVTDVGDGTFKIEFINRLKATRVTVAAVDNVTAGTPVVTEVVQGGATAAGGPFTWGPVIMPDEDVLVADVISTVDDGEIYEGDSLLVAPDYVYS